MSQRDKGSPGRTPEQSKTLSKEIDIVNQLSRDHGAEKSSLARWLGGERTSHTSLTT